jgi:hypothetical protein
MLTLIYEKMDYISQMKEVEGEEDMLEEEVIQHHQHQS